MHRLIFTVDRSRVAAVNIRRNNAANRRGFKLLLESAIELSWVGPAHRAEVALRPVPAPDSGSRVTYPGRGTPYFSSARKFNDLANLDTIGIQSAGYLRNWASGEDA